jgi:hypothetical protein
MNSIQAWTISDQSILRTKIQGFKFHLLHKLGLSLPNESYRPMESSIALQFFSFTKLASPYPQQRSAHVGMTAFWNFCATDLETVSIQSTLAAHQIPCHNKKKNSPLNGQYLQHTCNTAEMIMLASYIKA